MIHINYPNGKMPKGDWIDKAKQMTDRLKGAPDKIARDKIIDDNGHVWGELRDWLATFSYDKCWFTEARDLCSYMQVQHPSDWAKRLVV